MNLKEKAELVIELLKEYLKYTDIDSYTALCNGYNSETDLTIHENPLTIFGEFSFVIGDEKTVLDITPCRIQKVYCNNPTELYDVVNFYELCGACSSEEDNGSWDKTIKYLQRVNCQIATKIDTCRKIREKLFDYEKQQEENELLSEQGKWLVTRIIKECRQIVMDVQCEEVE